MEIINDFLQSGLSYPLEYLQEWRTDIVRYDSGKEQRNQIWTVPIRHWLINLSLMESASREAILELFGRLAGSAQIFLIEHTFANLDDNKCLVTDWSYTAVGGETTTQLQKTYAIGKDGAWTENKTRIQPSTLYAPTIKIDTTTKTEGTHFTLDDNTGIINWLGGSSPNGALTAGQVITADYKFYYPVRFNTDTYKDIMDFYDSWSIDSLEIIQVKE